MGIISNRVILHPDILRMAKRFLFTTIFVTGLLISACEVKVGPATPTSGSPVDIPEPSFTPTIGPSTISGEFVLTNTSAPGMEVGIEMMNILLEHRLSVDDSWKKIEVTCSFNPPAPTILKDELNVQYTCQYQNQAPADAELRVTAEVKIYGSDEAFRLLVEPP
jgi:hypothetical protein